MIAKLILPGLYTIASGPVNTFLIDDPAGCVLIDTGYPGSADKILAAAQELGKRPRDIKHILLTHAHPDHIGSAAALKKATGAKTYMNALDAPIARAGTGFRPLTPAPGLMTGLLFRAFVRPVAYVEPTQIDTLIGDGEVLPIAASLTVLHVPGHSAGQVALLWRQHGGVLFAADTASNIMGLGLSLGYEDLNEGRRSLKMLAEMDFSAACFGHGKPILHDASERFQKGWA